MRLEVPPDEVETILRLDAEIDQARRDYNELRISPIPEKVV